MRHTFGISEYKFKKENEKRGIVLDTDKLINGHLLFSGMSGTGKSHQLRQLIDSATQQNIEIDIFDVHDELDTPSGTSVIFSEATKYGYNPLVLNSNPHSGGVRKRINEIISMINKSSRSLGTKQETALRNLLGDIYYLNGCYEDNASSWSKQEMTELMRTQLMKERKYKDLRNYYPTLEDVISYADRKIRIMYTGADSKAISALEQVNKLAIQLNRQNGKYRSSSLSDEEYAALEDTMEKTKEKASAAYTDYITKIESGRELSDIMKYNSKDVLQTVLERLQTFNASGIFRSNPPPFGNARVRVYQIKSLSDEEQKMFVYNRMESIFREKRDRGISNSVQHAIILDEAHKFASDDSENILNVIAKESRKFGLALWCASQSPTHFSEDFLTNCGTTVLLGIHSSYWDMACRKLQIDRNILKYVKPHVTAAIKLQRKASTESRFYSTLLEGSY